MLPCSHRMEDRSIGAYHIATAGEHEAPGRTGIPPASEGRVGAEYQKKREHRGRHGEGHLGGLKEPAAISALVTTAHRGTRVVLSGVESNKAIRYDGSPCSIVPASRPCLPHRSPPRPGPPSCVGGRPPDWPRPEWNAAASGMPLALQAEFQAPQCLPAGPVRQLGGLLDSRPRRDVAIACTMLSTRTGTATLERGAALRAVARHYKTKLVLRYVPHHTFASEPRPLSATRRCGC
eukprot:scaffold705_cov402-Prasinococcus_capsulatus_cf.AAC.20